VAGYLLMAIFGWIGIALIYRASKLYRKRNGGVSSGPPHWNSDDAG
jgi:hypothetical protein